MIGYAALSEAHLLRENAVQLYSTHGDSMAVMVPKIVTAAVDMICGMESVSCRSYGSILRVPIECPSSLGCPDKVSNCVPNLEALLRMTRLNAPIFGNNCH